MRAAASGMRDGGAGQGASESASHTVFNSALVKGSPQYPASPGTRPVFR